MDERSRRPWAGAEAGAIGYGAVAAVARATGMAISTVRKGRDEGRALNIEPNDFPGDWNYVVSPRAQNG